jgi:arginase family enzyme
MKGLVSVIDFDQVYQTQPLFRKLDCEWIDLLHVKNANRYCELQSLLEIKKKLQKRQNRRITFIGSGNYHYVTYLLLSEIHSPFTLVLFDHHTDMMASPSTSLISCGSWVLHAMKRLPMLKKVVIVGVREDLVKTIPEEYKKKVSLFTSKDLGWCVYPIKNRILSAIPTRDVYISIDKDVLNQTEAVTNWDQGNMKLVQLLHLLQSIYENKKVLGVDICGEQSPSPADLFRREYIQGAKINGIANQHIFETVLMSMSKQFLLANYKLK